MLQKPPNHSLVGIREKLGLSRKELACLLFPRQPDPDAAERIIAGCQNGSNSLSGRPQQLELVVSIFGLRPQCVVPIGHGRHTPVHLVSLSGFSFTRAWFLAWTYSGLEPAPDACFKPEMQRIFGERMALALRVERATQLYDEFLNRHIEWRAMECLRGRFLDDDDIEALEARIPLPSCRKSLVSDREWMAKKHFSDIAADQPAHLLGSRRIEDLADLTAEFDLTPVFQAIGYTQDL